MFIRLMVCVCVRAARRLHMARTQQPGLGRSACLSRLIGSLVLVTPGSSPSPSPSQGSTGSSRRPACMQRARDILRCVAGRVSGAVACRHGPMASAGVPVALPPVRGPYCQWGGSAKHWHMRWRGLSAWVCGLPAGLGCSAGVGVGVLLGGHAPVDPCLPASSMHAAVPFPSFHQGQAQGGTRAGQSRRMTYATPPGTVVRRAPRCDAVRCVSPIGDWHTRRQAAHVPRPGRLPGKKTIALLRRHSSSAARTAALLACRVAKV